VLRWGLGYVRIVDDESERRNDMSEDILNRFILTVEVETDLDKALAEEVIRTALFTAPEVPYIDFLDITLEDADGD
jgi:hypothetical protein